MHPETNHYGRTLLKMEANYTVNTEPDPAQGPSTPAMNSDLDREPNVQPKIH